MRRTVAIFLFVLAFLLPVRIVTAAGNSAPAGSPTRAAVLKPTRPMAPTLRAQLQRILAKPEYQPADLTWLQRVADKVLRAIAWILRHLRGGGAFGRLFQTSPVLYWTIVISLLIVLFAILYHMYLGLRAAFGPRRQQRRASANLAPLPVTNPKALRYLADQAAKRGDFEAALRYLYVAVLRYLDRSGVLPFERGRTNWEYVAALRGKAEILVDFQPLTLAVDRVMYGGASAGATDWESCVGRAESIWNSTRAAHG